MKKIILILSLITINFTIHSQFQQSWVARYEESNSNFPGNNIGLDQYGNSYFTGTIGSGTNMDIITIKYNSDKVEQWVRTYHSAMDFGIAIAVDYNTGDSYILGQIVSGNKIFVTIKYNTNGEQQWINLAGAYQGFPKAITLDQYSNVYITGRDQQLEGNDYYLTIKYNSSGVQQWYSRYRENDNSNDFSNDIAVDNSGNVYVTGQSNFDYATVKYNSNGIQQWVSTYDKNHANDIAYSIGIYDNAVYITGKSPTNITKWDDFDPRAIFVNGFSTIKYNSNGVQQWVARYDNPNFTNSHGIKLMVKQNIEYRDESIYVTGDDNNNILTFCYSSLGAKRWSNTYSNAIPSSIVIDNNGNAFISGYSTPLNSSDFLTLQYNLNGQLIWHDTYNGPANGQDEPYSINLDPTGNRLYLYGYSTGNTTGSDFTLIKYIRSTDNDNRFTSSTLDNYPNPFNPTTQISFNIPKEDYITLKVYNLIGEELITLIDNEFKQKGNYNIQFDAKDLPSGVYFYKLTSLNFSKTQKMLLVK